MADALPPGMKPYRGQESIDSIIDWLLRNSKGTSPGQTAGTQPPVAIPSGMTMPNIPSMVRPANPPAGMQPWRGQQTMTSMLDALGARQAPSGPPVMPQPTAQGDPILSPPSRLSMPVSAMGQGQSVQMPTPPPSPPKNMAAPFVPGTAAPMSAPKAKAPVVSKAPTIKPSVTGSATGAPNVAPDLGEGRAVGADGLSGIDPFPAEVTPELLESHQTVPAATGLPGMGATGQAPALPNSTSLGSTTREPGQGMADLSSILGAYGSGEKANRMIEGQFSQNYDNIMMNAAANRRADETDAMRKLGQTGYLNSGGSTFTSPTIQLNGQSRTTPNLGYGPTPVSDAEKQGAATLEGQMLERLKPGGSYTPVPLDNYAKPGVEEKIGSYGALGTGAVGAAQNMMNKGGNAASGISGLLSGMPGALGKAGSTVGKVLPGVGGALGAVDMLNTNNSLGHDLMSGAGTGASIGSFAGPIGTAVGSGLGALVGGLKHLFGGGKKKK